MIAGQSVDLRMTDREIDFPTLEFIHSRKTGALFMASAALGALSARARPAELAAVVAYAKNLGLAFQIVDDLIDVDGRRRGRQGRRARTSRRRPSSRSRGSRAPARSPASSWPPARPRSSRSGRAPQPLRELARYVVARRR